MSKKYKVEFVDCGGGCLELDGGVKVFEVNSFEELMGKIVLENSGGDMENVLEYWGSFVEGDVNMKSIVEFIVEGMKIDKEYDVWDGRWLLGEDVWVKIFDEGGVLVEGEF